MWWILGVVLVCVACAFVWAALVVSGRCNDEEEDYLDD